MIEQTRGEDDMDPQMKLLTQGFTECQLYRAYSSLGNLLFLKSVYQVSVYPVLEITKEDIAQIEGWIKNHAARCMTGCNPV